MSVGVAVKPTDVPEHEGFVPDVKEITTLGVTIGLTTLVIALEVAGLPKTPLRFEVITHVTGNPLVRVVVVNVGPVPELTPFTFH